VGSPSDRVYALLNLLEDEDPDVMRRARDGLVDLGEGIEPFLRDRLEEASLRLKVRIRDVLSRRDAPSLRERFAGLAEDARARELDLEEALFAVARIGDPHLRVLPHRRRLDGLAGRIERRLQDDSARPPGRVVQAVNQVLFERCGFRGDREAYYSPDNSYLHRVLERRRGIPLSLASIVLLIARRLDLPFRGVAMPAHFMLSYPVQDQRVFIDVFNRGAVINRDQCREFLEEAGFDYTEAHLQPATDRQIVERFLKNLINAFRRVERPRRALDVQGLLKSFQSD